VVATQGASGWSVYPGFIPDSAALASLRASGDQIISKTYYMTRVEGENTRLRHYLARLHRKTLCYSRITINVETFDSIATSLSQIQGCSRSCLIHPFIQQCRKMSDSCAETGAVTGHG